jgi:hypothetical protein
MEVGRWKLEDGGWGLVRLPREGWKWKSFYGACGIKDCNEQPDPRRNDEGTRPKNL